MLCHHVHIITTPLHSAHPSTMQGNENYNNFKASTIAGVYVVMAHVQTLRTMRSAVGVGFVCGNVQAAGIVHEWVQCIYTLWCFGNKS